METDLSTYNKLMELLDKHGAKYREIPHKPEGSTPIVSKYRGNELAHAAKCMVVMVKLGKKVTKWVLAIIPGDTDVDFNAIKQLKRATFVRFAALDKAEAYAGSVAGTVLPFSFNPKLEMIVDPELLGYENIYFNAARLDLSLELNTADYWRIVEHLAEEGVTVPPLREKISLRN